MVFTNLNFNGEVLFVGAVLKYSDSDADAIVVLLLLWHYFRLPFFIAFR